MKTLLLTAGIVLFVTSYCLFNITNKYPVTIGWIFNDTGNCDIKVVST